MISRGALPENATAKPIAVGTGQTRVISSGTNVRIRCELTSVTEPPSDIIWRRSGETEDIIDDGSKFTIVSTGRESELTVAMFGADDVGNYQCIASNIVGSDAASVKLELCPPDAIPCSPVTNDTFNVVLEVTEGLDDTCTYCAMWHVTEFGPVSLVVGISGVVSLEREVSLGMICASCSKCSKCMMHNEYD